MKTITFISIFILDLALPIIAGSCANVKTVNLGTAI